MTPTINAYNAAFQILKDAGIPFPRGMILDKVTFGKLVKESGVPIVSSAGIGNIQFNGVSIRESRER